MDQLPLELRKDEGRFNLTIDRSRVMAALDESREDEEKWPEWQLLWEQHPVAQKQEPHSEQECRY